MFEIKKILTDSSQRRVDFDYQYSGDISKYFSKNSFYCEYSIDLKTVPDEILSIPLLANVLPISWFAGFDVKVDKLDKAFYEQVIKLKQQFAEYHPIINSKESKLIVNSLIDSDYKECNKTAMLFSGGVDAYASLLRHYEEVPDLITIKGADIPISDDSQWIGVLEYNTTTKAIQNNTKYYIESNIRDFITYEVDQLLPSLGWWGKIQHGLALTSLTAPLSYLYNYKTVYIASSYTRKENYDFIVWGSMPEIDNLVKFHGTEVCHDAAELTRQEKIDFIVQWSTLNKRYVQLRVCYSDLKEDLNCSVCEKCLRTIYAICINNENPNNFGFKVDFNLFEMLKKTINNGYSNEGNKLFWNEIYLGSINAKRYNDEKEEWRKAYEEIDQLLKVKLSQPLKKLSVLQKKKLNFIGKNPKLFKQYLKIKRKFL